MDQKKFELEVGRRIQLARKKLGVALRHIEKQSPAQKTKVAKIAESISGALSVLFEAETADEHSTLASGAQAAMEHLQNALDLLHAESPQSSSLGEAQEIIAKTLALLYPISKLSTGLSRIPKSADRATEDVPTHERRTAQRMAIEADIGFQSDTNFFMGFTEDISTGGLFIATYDIRSIGAKISVNFTLPNGHLVSVDGVVRWVREYNDRTPDTMPGMGVQFENLLPDDKVAIHAFIEQRQPIFYDE